MNSLCSFCEEFYELHLYQLITQKKRQMDTALTEVYKLGFSVGQLFSASKELKITEDQCKAKNTLQD